MRTVLLLMALAVATSCSNAGGSDGGGADAQVGEQDGGGVTGDGGVDAGRCPLLQELRRGPFDGGRATFCDVLVRVACDAYVRCGMHPASRALCEADVRFDCQRNVEGPLRAGVKGFSDLSAQFCLEDLALLRCDDLLDTGRGPLCQPLEPLSASPGVPCTSPFDCKGGWCPPLDPRAPACTACVPAAQSVGQPCSSRLDCPFGYTCTQDNVCAAPAGPGESCAAGRPCQGEELFCRSADQRCTRRPGLGERCDEGMPCAPGHTCEGSDGGTFSCQPARPDGAPCTSGLQCLDGHCRLNPEHLEAPGVCGARCVGEPCGWHNDCQRGAWCKGYRKARGDAGAVPGVCAQDLADGAPCDDGEEWFNRGCGFGSECRGGRCARAPFGSLPPGAPCSGFFSDDRCADGYQCALTEIPFGRGQCVPGVDAGERCSFVRKCGVGTVCQSSSCAARIPLGQPCAASSQCGPYQTCLGPEDGGPGPSRCTLRGDGGLGTRCQVADDCDLGTVCEVPSRRCASAAPAGTPCFTNDSQCLSGVCQGVADGGSACAPVCW